MAFALAALTSPAAGRMTAKPLRQRAPVSLRAAKGTPLRQCRQARPAALRVCAAVADLTDADFQKEVVESDLPVFLDFTATWCGPCRMIKPLVDEIAVEFKGKVKVFTVDIDKAPETAKRYGIKSIPVCMVVKKGDKVDARIGAVKKFVLTEMLAKAIA